MTITGTIRTKAVRTDYPVEDGLTAETTTQQGHVMQLEPETSLIPDREKKGL